MFCLFEQREAGLNEPQKIRLRSLVFTLTASGITAVEWTGRSREGKAAGTPTQ
jgi:hypothetical protein